jgi:hypothetical protein
MTERELDQIAIEGYLYFYPLILMDVTRRVMTNLPAGVRPLIGPPGSFTHADAFPSARFRDVVRPNFDTLYSLAWLDVSSGPVVVDAPDTGGRYYMLPMLDMWTDVFASPGSRTTGTGEGHFALIPPGWSGSLPDGLTPIVAPTNTVWVIGRTQTNGASDYAAVHEIQRGYRATPLSTWPDPDPPTPFVGDDSVDMVTPPALQVASLDGLDYFAYGAELMRLHPPHFTDQPILARLRRLGIVAGQSFDPASLPVDARAAIRDAPATGLAKMRGGLTSIAQLVNGWSIMRSDMGVYGTNYYRRAVVALLGLGANLAEDAIYPTLLHDADGNEITGDNDYVIHFDSAPPVDAFWSVTMYDAEGFPFPNDIDRQALGDRDPLDIGADGSIDIFISRRDPGPDRVANWIPAPEGPLGITLRLYAPGPEILDGTWEPPVVTRADFSRT